MSESAFRKMVTCVLLFLVPSSLFGADSNAAMLYIKGTAWVNGTNVPRASSAIFSGDLLQTRSDTIANINTSGSSITVQNDSLVQYEGSLLKVEHGGVTISTSKGMGTSAGGVKITPVASAWTEFNVTDVDGLVRIAARKGDLTITDGNETVVLAQGQETTRQETSDDSNNKDQDGKDKKKKDKRRVPGAAPAAGGGILNTPVAVGVGAAAIGGVTAWVLIESNKAASPSAP